LQNKVLGAQIAPSFDFKEVVDQEDYALSSRVIGVSKRAAQYGIPVVLGDLVDSTGAVKNAERLLYLSAFLLCPFALRR
jgi:hypothetical protein